VFKKKFQWGPRAIGLLASAWLIAGAAVDVEAANSVSGEAYGVFAETVTPLGTVTVGKTPRVVLPPQGGADEEQVANVDFPGLVASDTLAVQTTGTIGAAQASATSTSTVEDANAVDGLVTATVVRARSTSDGNGTTASSSAAGSTILGLVVNGIVLGDVTPPPNTVIPLPVGVVVLNEQVASGNGMQTSGLTVNMIHVIVSTPVPVEVVIASAHSDVSFSLTPEAEAGPRRDATVVHGQKNLNNGANGSLLVGQQIHPLFAFDMSGIDPRKVLGARLVLRVCYTPSDPALCPDRPDNWPVAGGDVFAYRLRDGFERWAEGNGDNFPVANSPHGSGRGVTWNCVIDSNIANVARNCTGANYWATGGIGDSGPARGPVKHFDFPTMDDGSVVEFDVTTDVRSGLGPADRRFMTFIVRKPQGGGSVSYYSREGAAERGDASFAPQLIVTLAP